MTSVSETAPRRPLAITVGLATALAFAFLFLATGLWNPVGALPLAAIFLAAAYGIYKRHAWSAYGGALLLAALAARAALSLSGAPSLAVAVTGAIALTGVILGLAVAALFQAGRRMLATPAPTSRALWIALAAAVLIFPQYCRAYIIASGSMENTIMIGDQILVVPFTGAPERGELVQFRYPIDPRQSFLKRVAAIGGDRVRLRDKQLIVNGKPVNEPYAIHRSGFTDTFRDNFPAEPNTRMRARWTEELRANTVDGELVVPPGKFFVLGDNRDDSLDSRYFGLLDRSDFTGKPLLIYFSTVAPAGAASSSTPRPPILLHPSRIRWTRMFKGL